jgi:hypothetical protein
MASMDRMVSVGIMVPACAAVPVCVGGYLYGVSALLFGHHWGASVSVAYFALAGVLIVQCAIAGMMLNVLSRSCGVLDQQGRLTAELAPREVLYEIAGFVLIACSTLCMFVWVRYGGCALDESVVISCSFLIIVVLIMERCCED